MEKCIKEFGRVSKSGGKLVVDIPNLGTDEFEITSLIEKSLGREDKFNYSILEFEEMISKYFIIYKKEIEDPMIQYFLVKRFNND